MKIWMVNHYAEPYARHHNLALELARRGHQVIIFASSFAHKTRTDTRLAQGEKVKSEFIDGIPFVWMRTPPYSGNNAGRFYNMGVFAWRLWRAARSVGFEAPEVIIGSTPHLFAALAAERLARSFKVPYVLEVRDLWPQSIVDLYNLSDYHPVVWGLERIERYLYRHAVRIVSLLPEAVEHMEAKGADRDKVAWIPNGINTDLVPPPAPPSDDGVFTVMYAGAHGLANSLDTLLEAAQMVRSEAWGKEVRFRFVGDGPEKQRLVDMAIQKGLDNVCFDNSVPRNKIYNILREADVFVMPLKYSPVFRWGVSPNKLFDYLATARPVIFSIDSPNNPVQEVRAGITIPPEEPYSLVQAIKELLGTSPEERWQMGLRGREYVERYHRFSRLCDKLEKILDSVVNKDNGSK